MLFLQYLTILLGAGSFLGIALLLPAAALPVRPVLAFARATARRGGRR